MKTANIDLVELNRFSQHAAYWWDRDGPFKTLHDINPARLDFIKKLRPLRGKDVLDVGCGGGIFSEALAKEDAAVVGLDVEEQSIAIAKEHAAQNNHLTLEYICKPLEEYQGKSFDLICCLEMLEHVPDPAVIIQHCVPLLKPGGLLVLSTIHRHLIAYLTVVLGAEYLFNLLPRQTHDFSKFIKPSELVQMTRKEGLQLLELQGLHYNPLTRQARLDKKIKNNYLMACLKS